MSGIIYHTWQGSNANIPSELQNSKTLAASMHHISQSEIYTSSLEQFEQFCHDALCKNSEEKNCFNSIFLYSLNNTITGFLNVRVAFTEAEIDFLCIDSNCRRQHIAENLLHFFEEFILHKNIISHLFLEVGINNFPAIYLYEKLGFKKISIRKKYYKNGEDALVMSKVLHK